MATDYRDDTPLTDAQKASLVGLATAIRTKMYGKDVREAIASAIEMVGQPGVDSYFTPKGVVADLAALESKFPNGTDGIYITKDDGYWCYWDGSAWQKGNVYQSTKIAGDSINPEMLDFDLLKYDTNSSNYCISENLTFGYYRDCSTGQEVEEPNHFYVKMSVAAGSKLYVYGTSEQMVFVNDSGTVIKGYVGAQYFAENYVEDVDGNQTYIGTVPNGATKAYVAFKTSNFGKAYVGYGGSDILGPTTISDLSILPKSIKSIKNENPVMIDGGINLFDSAKITSKKYVDYSTGKLIDNSDYNVSDYIPVDPRVKYTVETTNSTAADSQLAFFDGFKNYCGGIETAYSLKDTSIPSNCRYIRISMHAGQESYINFYPLFNLKKEWLETVEPQTIHIGSDQKYTTLLAGLEQAIKKPNSLVIVHAGTYDVIQEYLDEKGTDFFDTDKYTQDFYDTFAMSSRGLPLGNGMTVIFENQAKIVCKYTGKNTIVQGLFSCFYNYPAASFGYTINNYDGFKIIGAHITSSRIHYDIHDDLGLYKPGVPIINRIWSCNFNHDNTNSAVETKSTVIGGGLTYDELVEVKDNVIVGVTGDATVSYHNHSQSGSQSTVICKENYFGNGNTFEAISYGDQTDKTDMLISGNSLGAAPYKANYPGETMDNIILRVWNNEIRS